MKTRLTKTNRLAFIASLCAGHMSAVMVPTSHDLNEEAHLITHGQDSGKLTVDDDLPELASSLPFETAKEDKGDDSILSPSERRHLVKERLAYRIRRDLSAARNPFALAVI